MLNAASFAFLIMTAEDEHADSTLHARENVVHEVGLFQGKLGIGVRLFCLSEAVRSSQIFMAFHTLHFRRGTVRPRLRRFLGCLSANESSQSNLPFRLSLQKKKAAVCKPKRAEAAAESISLVHEPQRLMPCSHCSPFAA